MRVNEGQTRSDLSHSEAWASILADASRSHARLTRAVELGSASHQTTCLLQALDRGQGRIARELHAGACQPLTAIRLHAQLLERVAGSLPESGVVALRLLSSLGDDALEQIRAVSHRLQPPAWQRTNLPEALRTLVETSGLAVKFSRVQIEIASLPVEPGWSGKTAVYRCAQECISNAIRHSEGFSFCLRLKEERSWLQLHISDNGKGIAKQGADRGLGLRAIRYYATAAGGDCRVLSTGPEGFNSGNYGGTTVTVRVPFGH